MAARLRCDEMFATAPPARRFVLLEVPGPWHTDLMTASGLGHDAGSWLRRQLAAAGARLLLIRRPGRHPAGPGRPRRWAVAAVAGGVRWGHWRDEQDLLGLDLVADLEAVTRRPAASQNLKPLALVCTHGRHDLCCALQGREVAAAVAADPRADVWECSHLGGDRFAANLLWLPSGVLLGSLDAANCAQVFARALDGHVVLEHYRGRCGDLPVAQAAQWQLMAALGETRPDRVVIERPDPASPNIRSQALAGPGGQVTLNATHEGRTYRVDVTWSLSPAQKLTCSAITDSRVRIFRLARPPQLQ